MTQDLGPRGGPVPGAGPACEAPDELLDAVGEGLVWIESGRVVGANAAAAELVGCEEPGALVGRAVDTMLEDAGNGLPAWGLPPRGARAVECGVRRDDGQKRRVRVTALPESPGRVVWTLRDVTRERSLEDELHRSGRELLEARQRLAELEERVAGEADDREELLTLVSHELRTPLTVIAGFNKLLLSEQVGELNEKQRHFLQQSANSCRRVDAFVANLIEGARARTGEVPVDRCEGSLSKLVKCVMGFLEPLLAERRLRIELDLAPDAERACFDAMRIEQVLTNLIGNALRYSPPGAAIAVATRRLEAAGHAFVEVAVSDQGRGIPDEDRERVFEPYVRDGEAGGLGLGLAICRRIVEGHGGSIAVGSSRAGGSRFAFTLPAPDAGEGAR